MGLFHLKTLSQALYKKEEEKYKKKKIEWGGSHEAGEKSTAADCEEIPKTKIKPARLGEHGGCTAVLKKYDRGNQGSSLEVLRFWVATL
ncbi:unnamed protein product [Prunus armeniaca]